MNTQHLQGLSQYKAIGFLSLFLFFFSCSSSNNSKDEASENSTAFEITGSIDRLTDEIDDLIPEGASIEIIASGFEWSEGPLWLGDYLIFSDVPKNKIYKWSETDGLSTYLEPSGYLGNRNDKREPGSNGLALDPEGRLILCQHGERQVGRMASDLTKPIPAFVQMVNNFGGKRFNSPNDLVFNQAGEFYFTDPPYGLDPWQEKELDFQGVYKVDRRRNVTLMIDSLSRPNGIGLSPDERTLYVAVSDPESAKYYAFDIEKSGIITGGRVLLDVTPLIGEDLPGLPDGLKVDSKGNIWATGPGGVLVISPEGAHLGSIKTGVAAANCTFNGDESVLYITADMHLMRVVLKNDPS